MRTSFKMNVNDEQTAAFAVENPSPKQEVRIHNSFVERWLRD
ncbi:MAG: hypothetical protein QXR42_09490 [Candidatus Bathyarchaeia archaeon]